MNRVGRYLVEETNADGSLVARDPALDRRVVIHLVAADGSSEDRGRFERHGRAAAAIDHPNVARVLEVGDADGAMFVASEHVGGVTLGAAAPRAKVATVERWLVQIADAIQAIHAAGIVHRQVDDTHVRIATNGVAKLVDFSSARVEADDSFRTRTIDRREADSPAHDRIRWGAMALTVLGGRSSRLTSLARQAKEGRFEATEVLVSKLAASVRTRPTMIVVLAAAMGAVTLAIVVGALLFTRRRETVSVMEAATPTPPTAIAPEVDIAVAEDTEPPPASSATVLVEIPGSARAQIPDGVFSPENRVKAEAFVRANSAAFVACARTGPKSTLRASVGKDGHASAMSATELTWADRRCFYRVFMDHWPDIPIAQGYVGTFTIEVHAKRMVPP